ncbi:MAG: hypothetical protein L3K19_00200 [Thermoplasmata archaeon]|nr:hypothetical protein [Thermoplasmata archaeon]
MNDTQPMSLRASKRVILIFISLLVLLSIVFAFYFSTTVAGPGIFLLVLPVLTVWFIAYRRYSTDDDDDEDEDPEALPSELKA